MIKRDKIFLRSFPRDKTCPHANGDVIVSRFKFNAPLSADRQNCLVMADKEVKLPSIVHK